MTAIAWLAAVRRRGGTCRLDERGRVWVVPQGVVTPQLRAAFPELKAEIVAVLVERGGVTGSDAPAATFPCPGCGRALPVARSRDPDFTVCVCCKLDEIERRLR
jgi:hypothetical protein